MLKIAHRGYSARNPENTLPAFKAAMAQGVDMIEFDVHLTRDGVPVVIHDDTVDRTSDGKGFVRDMTLAELRAFNYSYLFPGEGEVAIPTLAEVLETTRGRCQLNIELKKLPLVYPGLEEAVCGLLLAMNMTDQAVISSFDHFSLLRVREIIPSARTGMLYDSVWVSFEDEIRKLGVYSVHPHIDAAYDPQLATVHERGIRVYPWVALTAADIARLAATGHVDGIMVNDPALFG